LKIALRETKLCRITRVSEDVELVRIFVGRSWRWFRYYLPTTVAATTGTTSTVEGCCPFCCFFGL
jgi:hypothetical protein